MNKNPSLQELINQVNCQTVNLQDSLWTENNCLNKFIEDIEITFDNMYPMFDKEGCSPLECCEIYPNLFATILETLQYTKKWQIHDQLRRIVSFISVVGYDRFCMKGFLGQPHKSSFYPKNECGHCIKTKLDLKQLDSQFAHVGCMEKFIDIWNKPRDFNQFGNCVASSRP